MLTFEQAIRAIKRGDIVLLRDELDAGLSPNLTDIEGSWTLLMVAASNGDTRIGRLLIERGADVNTIGKHQGTALLHSAYEGNVSFVRMLLAAGASLNFHQRINLEYWLRVFYRVPEVTIKKLLSLLGIDENHCLEDQWIPLLR